MYLPSDPVVFLKSFYYVFYHQIRNGIQGCTARAPPLSRWVGFELAMYVVPLSNILGLGLPLMPAGDHARSMHGCKDACYPLGICDRQCMPGSGSPLFYINTWAMVKDYPALAS